MLISVLCLPPAMMLCVNAQELTPSGFKRIESAVLPNAIRVTPKLISGGLPEGDEAFQQLRELGVRTIISVDGAAPDIATARKYGLRYVHLPHGYDGIQPEHAEHLAKAVHDLDGPFYIHCHHGKHRSPAATAVVAIKLGILNQDQGIELLRVAGTSSKYEGLFRSVRTATSATEEELANIQCEFSEIAEVPPLTSTMVELDESLQRLQRLDRNDWKVISNPSPLAASPESLLIRERYTELLRLEQVRSMPLPFLELLEEAEQLCKELESLADLEPTSDGYALNLRKKLEQIADNCAKCHQQFRDRPTVK